MALKLILIRHAKSAWDDPTLGDFDRPLNDRGQVSATAIADWLVSHGHQPDVVLLSGAARTVETWDRMSAKMPDTEVLRDRALYLAGADVILNVLRTREESAVGVICHNPGIADFANRILKAPPDHPKFRQYPTAATTIISFDAERWNDVTWFKGTCHDFVVPRDLI